MQAEHVIPRRRRGRFRPVVVKRPHPGIGPDHLIGGHRRGEILAGESAQIIALLLGAVDFARRAVMVLVGGADQVEILLIGDGENDPPVAALKEIAAVVIVKLRHHDMTAAHQPHPLGRGDMGDIADHILDPGTAGIDKRAGLPDPGAVRSFACDLPELALPLGMGDAGPGQDARAPRLGIAGAQHHQPRILHPAIRILVSQPEARFQRPAGRIARQIQPRGPRQDPASAEPVVKEQPQSDQPGRPPATHPGHDEGQDPRGRRIAVEAHIRRIGQHETHRPADMGHGAQQRLAFVQRLADQPEFEIFEIAQPAMKQLGRGRRGSLRQIALLGQHHRQPAPGGVAGNAAPVHPAADDEQIDRRGRCRLRQAVLVMGLHGIAHQVFSFIFVIC